MRYIITILLILTSANPQAALYKSQDENGEVTYSDVPPYTGAKEMTPPFLQTTPAVKHNPAPKPETDDSLQNAPTINYLSFSISQPKEGETVRDNSGNVTVVLKLEPELNKQEGHYINIYIDDNALTKHSSNLTTILNTIDRGRHSIKAEIRNQQGKVLKTTPSQTFYLHRFSILHKKPAQIPPANP